MSGTFLADEFFMFTSALNTEQFPQWGKLWKSIHLAQEKVDMFYGNLYFKDYTKYDAKIWFLFLAATAALEVQMLVCLSVCVRLATTVLKL